MLQLSTLSLSLPPYLPPSASSVHFRVMPSYADGAAQLPRSSQQMIFENTIWTKLLIATEPN